MTNYLGLDISTTCTGWSLITLDDHQNVSSVKLGYIPMSKIPSTYDKAQKVLEAFEELNTRTSISRVFIEENLQAFRPGASSAKTLVKLARFNGVVSYVAQSVFGVEPEFINVNHARKVLGIKIQREKVCGISTKNQVLMWAKDQEVLGNLEWPKKILKSGPRKGLEIDSEFCYDMADAYVISRAGFLI